MNKFFFTDGTNIIIQLKIIKSFTIISIKNQKLYVSKKQLNKISLF